MYPDWRKHNSIYHNLIKTQIFGINQFQVKKNSKNFVVLGQQWKKNMNAQINLGTIKKQGMTPQAIYMLVYKNAIANGLRTTQKFPL